VDAHAAAQVALGSVIGRTSAPTEPVSPTGECMIGSTREFRVSGDAAALMAAPRLWPGGWQVGTKVLAGVLWCTVAAASGPSGPRSASGPSGAGSSSSPGSFSNASNASNSSSSGGSNSQSKQEVSITAPEPRYVAPTLRDQIGRIWAPVMIDGKGPFRLVLDTGASHSAVTASVARALGILPDETAPIVLDGVTGSAVVGAIHVESLLVGDLLMRSVVLPIVPDALGGADGVLGTEGLLDKRIEIDFRNDRITIRRSHFSRAPEGYVTVPLQISGNRLLTTDAYVGSIRVTAIIDTGAQSSVANLALREALMRRRRHYSFSKDQIIDATDALAPGEGTGVPTISLGDIQIWGAHITLGDMHIFEVWKMTRKPAILIGMDALGRVDVLIIDYRRRELQILTHHSPFSTLFQP
jgi:predicted aspartyl protease